MPSSVIRAYSYDPTTRELVVVFQSGKRYIYLGVPESIYLDMKASFSKGDFFNARIREEFEFVRVDDSARS